MKHMILIFSFMTLFSTAKANVTVGVYAPGNQDVFICNAGIQHSGGETYCTNDEGMACDSERDQSCQCTSTSGVGDYLIGTIFEPGQDPIEKVVLPGVSSYNRLRSAEDNFLGRMDDVKFEFGSESLGANYVLQICYRGPESNLQAGKDLSEGIYKLKLTLSGGEQSYKEKVSARYSFSCDLRNQGLLRSARSGNEISPGVEVEGDSSGFAIGKLSGEINTASFNLNADIKGVPRFCIFNLELKEISTQVRDHYRSGGNFIFRADVLGGGPVNGPLY